MRFQGKVAMVTGGGAGIGRGIVLSFAREGADVAVLDIDGSTAAKTAQEAESLGLGGRSLPVEVDVASPASVEGAVQAVVERFGKIDILINNAGISPKRNGAKVPVAEMDPAEWMRVIAVNLTGAFLCSRAVLPGMIERRYGKIISMASVAGKTGGFAPGAHYTSSKAGIIGLTKAIALETAKYGINANTVMPSRIQTDMGFSIPEAKLKERLAQIPLGRLGTTDDVAEAVLFLASDKSAGWITGATINVSGGVLMD